VPDALSDLIASLSDEELWIMAGEERHTLIQQVRARLARQLGSRGYPPEMVARSTNVPDPNALVSHGALLLTSGRTCCSRIRPGSPVC
jgi:hypothetical protein